MAKSEDGEKCVVTGRECEFPLAFGCLLVDDETLAFLEALRILKVIPPEEGGARGGVPQGPRIEASRNFWEGSGLKIDSSSTDVVWAHGGESFDFGWAESGAQPKWLTRPKSSPTRS